MCDSSKLGEHPYGCSLSLFFFILPLRVPGSLSFGGVTCTSAGRAHIFVWGYSGNHVDCSVAVLDVGDVLGLLSHSDRDETALLPPPGNSPLLPPRTTPRGVVAGRFFESCTTLTAADFLPQTVLFGNDDADNIGVLRRVS